MKNVIKQIRKIKGVTRVEPAGEGMAVVLFEQQKKERGEWNWCPAVEEKSILTTEDGVDLYVGSRFWMVNAANELHTHDFPLVQDAEMFIANNETVYRSEFTYFSTKQAAEKWIESKRSLKPEDLVDGEIYVDECNKAKWTRIIRFGKLKSNGNAVLRSELLSDNSYYPSAMDYHFGLPIRHATISEKIKLIEQELIHEKK